MIYLKIGVFWAKIGLKWSIWGAKGRFQRGVNEPLFLGKNHYTCWAPIQTIKNDPNRYSKRFLGVFGPFSRWANDFGGFWPKIRVFWVFERRNRDLKNQFIRSSVKEPLALSHQMVKNFERAPFTRFVLSLRSLASLAHSTRSLRSLTTPAQNSSPSDALIEY